jgi:UDP-N-acetylmuramate: L-alanyl-gamma-D-glutamyl-meso-diaminopimelate ligase
LPGSLAGADRIFCYTDGLSWNVGGALQPLGEKAACYSDLSALIEAIAAAARSGDQVLIMSNGGFGGIHGKLLEALAKR